MDAFHALFPVVVVVALALLLVFGLKRLRRDRRRGSLAVGLESLQEVFQPETRKAHEVRDEDHRDEGGIASP